MDRNLRTLTRLTAALLFPLALAILVPTALVISLILYVGSLFHALGAFCARRGAPSPSPPPPAATPTHRGPHFTEVSARRTPQEKL